MRFNLTKKQIFSNTGLLMDFNIPYEMYDYTEPDLIIFMDLSIRDKVRDRR